MFCSQKKSRGFLIYGLVFRKEKKLEALLKPNLERSNILRRRKIRPWKSKIRGGKKKENPKSNESWDTNARLQSETVTVGGLYGLSTSR